MGLILLAALVIAIDGWLAEGRLVVLASVMLLALAASAAKTTVLPAVWAGLGVLVIRALLARGRVELRRAALALAATAAMGVPLTLWQTGGQEGYTGIVRLAPASVFTTSAFADALARLAGAASVPAWLAVPGFALWLLGYLGLAGAAALLWLVNAARAARSAAGLLARRHRSRAWRSGSRSTCRACRSSSSSTTLSCCSACSPAPFSCCGGRSARCAPARPWPSGSPPC